MFLDDVIKILQDAKVGTPGVNIHKSTKSVIPAGNGPFLVVTETGGSGPAGTHNAVNFGLPGYVRPAAQILVRGSTEVAARAMIDAAYAALVKFGQKSQFVNGVWWVKAFPLQEPFDLGVDVGMIQFAFNISTEKRPNAAMSQ